MLENLKKYWKAIVAVLGAIIGFLFLKQYLQKDLKAKLENANAAGKDAALEAKKEVVSEAINKSEDALKNLDKDHESAKGAANDMSKEDIENFYKERLKK